MQNLPNVAGSSDIWSKSAGGQRLKVVKLACFTVCGILSQFDKAQCKCYLAYGLDERGSVHITVQQAFPLSNPSSLAVRHTDGRFSRELSV